MVDMLAVLAFMAGKVVVPVLVTGGLFLASKVVNSISGADPSFKALGLSKKKEEKTRRSTGYGSRR